jgi:hypothetical protein
VAMTVVSMATTFRLQTVLVNLAVAAGWCELAHSIERQPTIQQSLERVSQGLW